MSEQTPAILLVEDDAQIRRVVATTLEAHGFAVHGVERGGVGLEWATAHPPDLVILDLNLPDGDGLDLIPELRSRGAREILVLSARDAEEVRVRALDLGADDFLAKPFGTLELLARVRVALRRARREPAREERFELRGAGIRIDIDVARRQVLRDGTQVHLTPIEFRLLSAMVRHRGKVLTHEHLLNEVWGAGQEQNTQYLRIFLGGLRKKLELDPARPRILLTLPGVGYRLALDTET
jgi:two-component system KDP operon response regulator KdpE